MPHKPPDSTYLLYSRNHSRSHISTEASNLSSTSRTGSSAQGVGNSNRVPFCVAEKPILAPFVRREPPSAIAADSATPQSRAPYPLPTATPADCSSCYPLPRTGSTTFRTVRKSPVRTASAKRRAYLHQSDLLRLECAIRPHLFI